MEYVYTDRTEPASTHAKYGNVSRIRLGKYDGFVLVPKVQVLGTCQVQASTIPIISKNREGPDEYLKLRPGVPRRSSLRYNIYRYGH